MEAQTQRPQNGAQDGPAYRDELTRLPRRALLCEHLALALARARQHGLEVALLHLGLDDFQLVNDSLGHDCGDVAIRHTAQRLEDLTGSASVLAHPGGDEFCVLITDRRGDAESVAQIVAGQIRAAFERPFSVGGREFQLTASTGASVFPKDAPDEESLLRHAEAAMRSAKRLARGSFVFYAGDTMESLERLLLTSRLRAAIERDELTLHYQPIFSLPDGAAVGAEALIRWDDPDRGLLPPARFIPVAEYTGLIGPIGRWVISQVCAQARAWGEEGMSVPISFNTSPRELHDQDFPAVVRDELSAHRLESSAITVEITESTAMEDPARVGPIIAELHRAGVRIGIDDFGTGYSSLSRLRHMPVQILKLDRAFLERAPYDVEMTRIATAVIELIRALGMTAVAEGVETEDQVQYLMQRGCPLAQGYHLAPPAPSEEAAEVIRAASTG